MSANGKFTKDLIAPTCKKEFTKEWARRIVCDYMIRTDPEWLLAPLLKIRDVMVKENPAPGKFHIFPVDKISVILEFQYLNLRDRAIFNRVSLTV